MAGGHWSVFVVAGFAAVVVAELTGPNVCVSLKTYSENDTVTMNTNYTIKIPYFCFINWNFTCDRLFNSSLNNNEVSLKYEQVKSCCEGYVPSFNETCVPFCKSHCNWGECIKPNVCKCNEGYEGEMCNIRKTCASGSQCSEMCKCQNNASCNPINGSCSCQPGYQGEFCEIPCPSGYYGQNCREICKCENDAKCDIVNGTCKYPDCFMKKKYRIKKRQMIFNNSLERYNCSINHCALGWTGSNCNIKCSSRKHGFNCNLNCPRCKNGGKCQRSNGVCICKNGYYGYSCSEACPKNYYMKLCLEKCTCNSTIEICDPNYPNVKCVSSFVSIPKGDLTILLYDVSIVLWFLLILTLCVGLILIYIYFYRQQIKKSIAVYENHFVLGKSTVTETDSNIRIISNPRIYNNQTRSIMLNVGKPFTYSNKICFQEYERNFHYNYETNEHIYVEIGEQSEELYDHLDFLRPTGSWKPHYQCAMVLQDQNSNSSSSSRSNNTSTKSLNSKLPLNIRNNR